MTEQNRAITTYTATGRTQVIQETFFIDTVTYRVRRGDPAAQTFSFLEDTMVTSIGVFFGTKDILPITMQLRNVVNGYPGPIVLASKTFQPSQVGVSDTAAVETKFTFEDPVLCNRDTQYCWVLMTEGAQYRIWIAKMGEQDVATQAWVPAQPFVGGTFFSSNDNLAWTAHQEMDAKFKIYQANFDNTDAVLNFNQITAIQAARLVLAVNQLTPAGTSIKWEVSLDGVSDWLPLSVNRNITRLPAKWANCYIRAILSGNGKSPIINLGSIVATGIKFALTGKYVNRNIVTLSNFTTINIWMDVIEPSGTSVTPKFSVNDGTSWTNATYQSSQAGEVTGSTQKYYKNTVASVGQLRIDLDFTGLETDTVEVRRLMVTLT